MFVVKSKCLLALCLANVAILVVSPVSVLAENEFREGYFDGSSHVRLTTPISLHNHIGLSFKSCVGGELFEQHTNGNVISLHVQPEGLLFQSKVNGRNFEVKLPVRLLNNAWQVVNLVYTLGSLTLSAGGQSQVIQIMLVVIMRNQISGYCMFLVLNQFSQILPTGTSPVPIYLETISPSLPLPFPPSVLHYCNEPATQMYAFQIIANRTFTSELFSSNLTTKNSVLRVGNGFVGCILEGPSLVFHSSNLKSVNVAWGPCILQSINCQRIEPCSTDVCMSHGYCVAVNDRYECKCTPRYSGVNCEIDEGSPCDRNPCQNNGRCEEDPWGNYTCICDSAHSGSHCELLSGALPCDTNPCMANGTCRVFPSAPNKKECICPPGFKGQFCEINVDECQSNPCRNGGICTDGANSYSCSCERTGYTGTRCEVNINECETHKPCMNEGTCFDNYGGYTCQCTPGFGGHNCELNLNECSSEPCDNGGRCEDKIGSYECICRPGFGGKNCQVNVNECDVTPAPCPPNFDCIDEIASRTCICKPGYYESPPTCTKNETLSPCPVSVCQNNGVCLTAGGDHNQCVCPPGFSGKNCEVNDCSPNPCFNGGSCYGTLTGYECVCSREYFGDKCEFFPNPCLYSNCSNNGVCYPKNEHEYYCDCPPGFDGLNCEINVTDCGGVPCTDDHTVCPDGSKRNSSCGTSGAKTVKSLLDPCFSSPCNNGTCIPNGDGYTCVCQEGITGPNCETDINECNENRSICNFGICYNTNGGYQCYCKPGYAGNHCDIDVDECLSKPCLHDAVCENNINSYSCICTPGYTGVNCGINIDECESNPCQNEGTCQDEVAGFTCFCPPGLTGKVCETNIDDCDPLPCENGGVCIDGINSYECNCTDTGYYGTNCEHNIDDCISNPCTNEAQCIDLVKGYECRCYPGFTGQNCEIDINECETMPCQNGGSCLERSNRTLYELSGNLSLPEIFSHEFDFKEAVGYECVCVPGTVGLNCEKDINECESNPCHFGSCKDEIGRYKCECEDGYEGEFCETEINECERYKPCVNGTCSDRRNDYYCDCVNGFGGKNCSVELIGCAKNNCANNGICLPYLENETEHKFNCSCPNGFHGKLCQKGTTMSLSGASHVLINTTRDEGYDIQFRFKTTLPNGLLGIGKGLTFYILELVNGRLNLRSSLLNKWEGVFVGSGLNDSKWQKVFVAINASHLVLAANEEQTIYPISLNEANTSHTSFQTTYLGGTTSYLRNLIHGPSSFVGCTEDVQVNGEWVIPQDTQEASVELTGVDVGCPREEQCSPNPCHSGGHCTDLWSNFSCSCERPYLGHTCQYNLTAATFGHETISSSFVTVQVNETTQRAVRNTVDISMFIRTRQDKGLIFYLGTQPGTVPYNEETFIIAQLEGGELRVRIQFGGNQESYSVGGVKLDNGHRHLIQVVRNSTLVQFRINNTEYFKNTIGTSDHLNVDVLYLGGMPKQSPFYNHKHEEGSPLSVVAPSRMRRQIESPPTSRIEIAPDSRMKVDPTKPESVFVNFKGIIQDVQISGGSRSKWVVEFFPLKVADLEVPAPFGKVTFDKNKVLEGEISDDTCRSNPCLHNGSCTITWNDYSCQCQRGYKGKSCQEMEFCQLQDCPTGSQCRNLDDGYECVANVTLRGKKNELLNYTLVGNSKPRGFDDVMLDSINISYRTRVGGTILHVSDNKYYLSVSVNKDEITIIWKLDDTPGDIKQFSGERGGNWTSIYMKMKSGKLLGGFTDVLDPDFTVNNFPVEAWRSLLQRGKILVGGVDTKFKFEEHIPVSTNSVNIPVGDILGDYYKGCLGEIRIGNLLLPFFTPNYLYNENFTAKNYFALESIPTRLGDEMGCILCYQEDCMNGGTCSDPNATYACDCPVGYTEDDCSKDIDWCEGEDRCENGATCVDGIANYTCTCPVGYTGVRCEINIDECASNPCVNGECVDQVGSFKCICKESYSGERCENLRIITCADRPCKRGSSCTNAFNKATGDNYTCTCLTGYVGRHCDIPFCIERECVNGICDHMKGGPRCVCSPGYEGQFCEKDLDECLSVPCQNNGKCIDRVNGFDCQCNEGYEGSFCENDVDECKRDETLCGDGFCNNTFGSYKCICNPKEEQKMCGLNCNITDPCAAENPCENGGTCLEKCTDEPLYECVCPEGYAGFNCTDPEIGEGTSPADIAIIVGPIVAFLLLAGAVGLSIFIMMARKKRATRGTYSPSQQEYCNPRVEMDNVLKPPPEERLI